jgi:hypothetical protein
MTGRRKTMLVLGALLGVLVLFFSKILFTHDIIRAPDIINEYYWSVQRISNLPLLDTFRIKLHAAWDIYNNSGNTLEGGGMAGQFLFWQGLIYHLIPPPESVAWFIVLHLFLGAAGTFMYCRAIGAGRTASAFAGLVFALAPETASLINAGHVLKIATISVAPWAFYFLERGFQTRRFFFFLTTGFVLALQFFYTHWQIAYYTCLAIGVYAFLRTLGILIRERRRTGKFVGKLFLLNIATLVFFLSTVAMDLMPLANWSTDTNRGVASGANHGKGGLDVNEAMLWSLPPEETLTFVIPGFFGFSRQEAGDNPSNIRSYYWGRMVFTQTSDYMGLLPWLLLPLPLLFRRDRYTWLALAGLCGGILFSMGKFTPFYWFFYDHFPGINHFRVPKMIMFIPVISIAVLAARGIDLLRDGEIRETPLFLTYLRCLAALPVVLLLLFAVEYFGANYWISALADLLALPTRYQQDPGLVVQRWNNLMFETVTAATFSAIYAAIFYIAAAKNRARLTTLAPLLLVSLFVVDVGRVDAKFLFLVPEPKETGRSFSTPVISFLSSKPKEYRVLPLNGGPEPYAARHIPVMFIPMPVQQVRWQDLLDDFSFSSSMPDMMNVKYLVYGTARYEQDKASLGNKYVPVFRSPDGTETVLENRSVLPKAWLVPAAAVVADPGQTLAILRDSRFDPRQVALVETPPPIPLGNLNAMQTGKIGDVSVTRYEGELIGINVHAPRNSLLVLGEKYYRGWKATIDGKPAEIYPVNHILRGVYLTPGVHEVEFVFDPLPFKIGKWLTLASFAFFAVMLGREAWVRRVRRQE